MLTKGESPDLVKIHRRLVLIRLGQFVGASLLEPPRYLGYLLNDVNAVMPL